MNKNTGTSNPHLKRSKFHPGLFEWFLLKTRLYHLAHYYHVVRDYEVRQILHHLKPGGTLIDIGCGDGYYTAMIAKATTAATIGIDLMQTRISKANYYNRKHRCKFLISDAEKLPFPSESFDQAVSVCALEHFDNMAIVLSEIHRVLKPGGHLVLTCDMFKNVGYTEEELIKHSEKFYVKKYFEPLSLQKTLEKCGFSVLKTVPILTSSITIKIIRGAIRLGQNHSDPIYCAYSFFSMPIIRIAERINNRAKEERGIFLLGYAQKNN